MYIVTDLTAEAISYIMANTDFPQQSTGDQFFDETQFESYRKLGYHSIKNINQLHLPL